MSAILDETPGRHAWTLGDHRVTQLLVDLHGFRLQSWALTESLEIRVAAPFRYLQADGSDRTIDPREPEQLAPVLSLLGRLVLGLAVDRDGRLELGFGDGSTLRAERRARGESWEVQGAGALEGLVYRASPGGDAPWA